MITEASSPEVSRHKCLIYDGHPQEQLPIVVPLLLTGLKDNRRCLYLGPPEAVEMVESALTERGIDLSAELRRGALILTSDRSHLDNGAFDPKAMVDMLGKMIDDAVRDGFSGLCATGDMMWELGTEKNFDVLLEYEALLEKVFREKPLIGICQYRREAVPAQAVQDALIAHRSVYVGRELNRDNLFYTPPELLLDSSRATRDRRGEWMCQQISRVLRAERDRDQAMEALRKSEAEQRRLAEKLAEANQGLEAVVKERTAELELANQELEAFSYSVSHDLRAPLRAVDAYARILVEDHAGPLDPEGKRRLSQILDGTRQMAALIDDLLKFSQAARSEIRPVGVDLGRLSRDVLDELLANRQGPKATVVLGDMPTAMGDPALLRQVLANLIGNALKYSGKRPAPRIEVGGRSSDAETISWVKDNGAGFDMAYAHKLFGAFQRLHGPSEFEGTGIGLALVRRIVERHGGRVWAEGEVGQGATFYFSLPKQVGSGRPS